MKFYIKYFLVIFSMFSFIKCGNYYKVLLKENSKPVANQYLLLTKDSDKFLAQPKQENFINELNNYVLECKDYNFKNGREPSELLSPIIVDKENVRAIALVLKRGNGISGDRIEFIKFISAKYTDNHWEFKLNEGYGYSFSYVNNEYKSFTNDELGKEAIRNLMLGGYFKKDIIQDKCLFNSSWYVLN